MTAVYGAPPRELVDVPDGAIQVSPLRPGAQALEQVGEGALARVAMLAPPGALERPYQLALALRALRPGGALTALGLKDKGGARLRKELERFGCVVEETARRHHRICTCVRPDVLLNVEEAVEAGGPRWLDGMGSWSQPGVFSWDRIDPGSSVLSHSLPALSGQGADLGCGVGYLARTVLLSSAVAHLALIDIDWRAVEAARRNIDDPRVQLQWADVTAADGESLGDLDFVVMNPPFHNNGSEDRELGQAFIRSAAQRLRRGGVLWLVANRHLPYEAPLAALFTRMDVRAEQAGFKVIEARR